MVDICMCHNGMHCPKSNSCYRYMAKASEYQTVADFYSSDEECDHYWPFKSDEERKQLDRDWRD